MDAVTRLYAFQKVSSLQEAAGYGAAGAGIGALGAGARGLYTGNRDYIQPIRDNLARHVESDAVQRAQHAQVQQKILSAVAEPVHDAQNMRYLRGTERLAHRHSIHAKEKLDAARTAAVPELADARLSTLKRAGKRAAGGALALGGLGAGIGLFS